MRTPWGVTGRSVPVPAEDKCHHPQLGGCSLLPHAQALSQWGIPASAPSPEEVSSFRHEGYLIFHKLHVQQQRAGAHPWTSRTTHSGWQRAQGGGLGQLRRSLMHELKLAHQPILRTAGLPPHHCSSRALGLRMDEPLLLLLPLTSPLFTSHTTNVS